LLHDVRAHAEDSDAIGVQKVVFKIELGEVEGDDELCEVGWEVGRTEEANSEVGTRYWLAGARVGGVGGAGSVLAYRNTCFCPRGIVGEEVRNEGVCIATREAHRTRLRV